jgi:ribosome-associated protein
MERIEIPFIEFNFLFSRSGGPGGQNVNKANTKVTLNWNLQDSPSCPEEVKFRFRHRFKAYLLDNGTVQITSQSHRSQKENLDECIRKLHKMLEEVRLPPVKRIKTKPKKSAVLKRLQSKKRDSEKKRLRKVDY